MIFAEFLAGLSFFVAILGVAWCYVEEVNPFKGIGKGLLRLKPIPRDERKRLKVEAEWKVLRERHRQYREEEVQLWLDEFLPLMRKVEPKRFFVRGFNPHQVHTYRDDWEKRKDRDEFDHWVNVIQETKRAKRKAISRLKDNKPDPLLTMPISDLRDIVRKTWYNDVVDVRPAVDLPTTWDRSWD